MKSLFPFLLIVVMVFSACSESKPSEIVSKNDKTEAVKAVGNRMLTLEIEGMTCVMGCGGSIRKQLAETQAIESCEFDFESGRGMNKAKISFDKDKISVDKIISIVSTMNKGQFKVGESESKDISVNIKTRVEELPNDRIDDGKLKVATEADFEMPNFVEILASFFFN
jgi:mercuric ion binding protein